MKQVKRLKLCGTPVLPAVYGESLSYGEVLGKMQVTINELIDKVDELEDRVEALEGGNENNE